VTTSIILLVYVSVNQAVKLTVNNRENFITKCISQQRLGCRYFYHIFTKLISNVTYVSISKLLISFENLVRLLSHLCQGKG
jgi:hypothetical protein